MIELELAINKELLEVYKAINASPNVYEEACLRSGAASLEWVLDRMKELDEAKRA